MTTLTHDRARYYVHVGPGQLTETEQNELNRHLDECGACRAYAAEVVALRSALSRVLHAHGDGETMSADMERKTLVRIMSHLNRRRLVRWGRSFAYVTVLVVAVILVLLFSRPFRSVSDVPGGIPLPPQAVPSTSTDSGIAIAAGWSHTCALTLVGGVKCWGYNEYGQLGDGTTTKSLAPVDVVGLTSGVTAITTKLNHTCALTFNGGVKCWGMNSSGQLGDGTNIARSKPVDVSGLTTGVVAISADGEHTCALMARGGVKCWGRNNAGQLGDGTTTDRLVPVDVKGLPQNVATVVAGGMHTCVLTKSGGVKCWGYNAYGELGDGTRTTRLTPSDVIGLTTGVRSIVAGAAFECVLTGTGTAKCWGYNLYGQLGDGTTTDRLVPVDIVGFAKGVAIIAPGAGHTCAVTAEGSILCWGYNDYGELGDGSIERHLTPIAVVGLAGNVAALAAGGQHTCAVLTDGRIECWGLNDAGQVGDGTTVSRNTPVRVVGF